MKYLLQTFMWLCLVSTPVTPVTVNVPLFENGSSIWSAFSNKWDILSKFFLTLPIADLCWEEIPKIISNANRGWSWVKIIILLWKMQRFKCKKSEFSEMFIVSSEFSINLHFQLLVFIWFCYSKFNFEWWRSRSAPSC